MHSTTHFIRNFAFEPKRVFVSLATLAVLGRKPLVCGGAAVAHRNQDAAILHVVGLGPGNCKYEPSTLQRSCMITKTSAHLSKENRDHRRNPLINSGLNLLEFAAGFV